MAPPGQKWSIEWEFLHSVDCRATSHFAWLYWTKVSNWAAVDPAIDRVTIDGGFVAGARGETITSAKERVDWVVGEVMDGSTARIDFPAPGAVLSAKWAFTTTQSGGCRVTQHLSLSGNNAQEYLPMISSEMERGVPAGMTSLAAAIDAAFDVASR